MVVGICPRVGLYTNITVQPATTAYVIPGVLALPSTAYGETGTGEGGKQDGHDHHKTFA